MQILFYPQHLIPHSRHRLLSSPSANCAHTQCNCKAPGAPITVPQAVHAQTAAFHGKMLPIGLDCSDLQQVPIPVSSKSTGDNCSLPELIVDMCNEQATDKGDYPNIILIICVRERGNRWYELGDIIEKRRVFIKIRNCYVFKQYFFKKIMTTLALSENETKFK